MSNFEERFYINPEECKKNRKIMELLRLEELIWKELESAYPCIPSGVYYLPDTYASKVDIENCEMGEDFWNQRFCFLLFVLYSEELL